MDGMVRLDDAGLASFEPCGAAIDFTGPGQMFVIGKVTECDYRLAEGAGAVNLSLDREAMIALRNALTAQIDRWNTAYPEQL